jgi:membrane protein DedA with SNARE-associated domain
MEWNSMMIWNALVITFTYSLGEFVQAPQNAPVAKLDSLTMCIVCGIAMGYRVYKVLQGWQ